MKLANVCKTLLGVSVLSVASFAFAQEADNRAPMVVHDKNPFPSSYKPWPSVMTAITNAHILTGDGGEIEKGTVLMDGGKIVAVGADVDIPAGAHVIDGTGKFVTPGVIDMHSHMGIWTDGGNDVRAKNTAGLWGEHSIWPQTPNFPAAVAAGVTTQLQLPGSANQFGGRSVTLKMVPGRSTEDMKFPGAPYGIKMACGENPRRVHKSQGGMSTAMGVFEGYRSSWIEATEYKKSWDKYYADYEAGKDVKAPKRDLKNETLMGVLNGEILIQQHCYRADEMVNVINMSKEFNYKVTSFHHVVEAYKIADLLAEEDICAGMWADWWGFKLESFDGIDENVPMMAAAGGCAIVHSDSDNGGQRLNQEAAKAWADGKRVGLDFTRGEVMKWITSNPARAIGLEDQIGTLAPGYNADVVIWNGDPFSVYALAENVFIDGALHYDRSNQENQWITDHALGYVTAGDHQ
ncbi:amidohydrolase family protein [Pseudemcibacter aquimaris]|uniref:amidohydrolase family protein n=1 Tax=Pseudemcibacter aquimaris TaxID=2857064 RepID=UPI0020110E20|nr:amidohydrolase family protein [Pseudemcibacter aquimaris]MCC3861087.1 amidohydrolase family protein [Pseudemcibacter aquimaris]WDU59905.1 amidohydrolase family protein [Pseudemcibacter aquimaris]